MGLNKLKVCILIISMLLSITSNSYFVVANAEVEATSENKLIVDKLTAFGILTEDDKNIKLDEDITKAEMVLFVARAAGFIDALKSYAGSSGYYDVANDHPSAAAIRILSENGIIRGDGNGYFYPDNNVTINEIAKMMVSVLGYGFIAVENGGYPTGYLFQAHKLNLFNNIDLAGKETISNEVALNIILNSLNAKFLEANSFGENISYDSSKTLLEAKHNVFNDSGIVTGTKCSHLSNDAKTSADTVEIGGKLFNVGNINTDELLGYFIDYYYKYDDASNDSTLVYIVTKKNDVIRINAKDILAETTTKEFVYCNKENEKTVKEKLLDSADFIYNGQAIINVQNIDLIPKSGYVELIDNSNDGNYDVIKITNYDVYVVDAVSASTGYIQGKYKNFIKLEKENNKYIVNLYQDGAIIPMSQIKEWNVLSVAQSKDKSIINAYVSTKMISGELTEISDDDAIKIYDDEYTISKLYSHTLNPYQVGVSGKFYFDVTGEVVAFQSSVVSALKQYALLYDMKTTSGLDTGCQLRLVTQKNDDLIIETAKKVKLNGGKKINASELLSNPLYDTLNKSVVRQIIVYELDEEQKVSAIYTEKILGTDEVQSLDDKLVKNAPNTLTDVTKSSTQYQSMYSRSSNANVLGGQYIFTGTTLAFIIPTNAGDNPIEAYSVEIAMGYLHDATYNFAIFNADANTKVTDVIAIYKEVTTTSTNVDLFKPVMLVTKISTITDGDGMDVSKVEGYQEGVIVTKEFKEKIVTDIRVGDVIQYETNKKNKITSYAIKATVSALTHGSNDPQLATRNSFHTGVITYKSANYMTLDIASQLSPLKITNTARVYEFNKGTQKAILGSIVNLEVGDEIFIRFSDGAMRDIVIYK